MTGEDKIYVAFSGGADSTATAIYLKEQGHEIELVFSDTGAELPETYWFIPRASRMLGMELIVLNNGTYFQHLSNYGYLIPGFQRRWCTRILKQVSQDAFFKDKEEPVAVGIRAEEAHRLSDYKLGGRNVIRPLVDAGIEKDNVFALCEKYDLLNPIYRWRSNTSCFCCQFQRRADWNGLLKEHPNLFALAESWEEESMQRAEERELTPVTYFKSARTKDGRWKTLKMFREAGEDQMELFKDPLELDTACAICRW